MPTRGAESVPLSHARLRQEREHDLRIDLMAKIVGVIDAVAGEIVDAFSFEQRLPQRGERADPAKILQAEQTE